MESGSPKAAPLRAARIVLVAALMTLGALAAVNLPALPVQAQGSSMELRVGPYFADPESPTFPKCGGSTTNPYIRVLPDGGPDLNKVWQKRKIQVMPTGAS